MFHYRSFAAVWWGSVLRKVESRISLRLLKARNAVLSDAKGLCYAYLRQLPRATEFLHGHLLRDQFCRAASTFLCCAEFSTRMISFTFLDMRINYGV
jgi:hypothetical protein